MYFLNPFYNEAIFKAGHNNEEINENIVDHIKEGQYVYDYNCSAIELDISQAKDQNDWSVSHEKYFLKNAKQLSTYFEELSSWSKQNPRHQVFTLYLDIKHCWSKDFSLAIDAYIKKYYTGKIFKPKNIQGAEENLYTGALKNAWPRLNQLEGMCIICITGEKEYKQSYSLKNTNNVLCFCDKDMNYNDSPNDKNILFYNYDVSIQSHDLLMKRFLKNSTKKI